MKLLTRSEEFVLLTVWKLQNNAYSLPIRKQIRDHRPTLVARVDLHAARTTRQERIAHLLSDRIDG